MRSKTLLVLMFALALAGCQKAADEVEPETVVETTIGEPASDVREAPEIDPSRFDIYAPFTLTADLSHLSDGQKEMVGLLIEAAKIMDGLFWRQAYGDRDTLLSRIGDEKMRRFAEMNYGPWDRLDANKPFVPGFAPKPAGAQFYPADMTRAEFEAWDEAGKDGQYSFVKRGADGSLKLVPYHVAFAEPLAEAAELLRRAAELAEDPQFATYLEMRADALLSDDFQASDMAWMDMKNNPVELVIGPIEHYEDQLYNYRTAYEGYVLIKDMAWSERLARFAAYLPELQSGLPVPDAYKAEMPGSDADLNAYDAVYYAGDCNAGSKTIAINLPNDEEVQLAKGTRRLQLKNAMRAKYDLILLPIADVLIAEDQREHVTFDAFFGNTMFHEVAHGLGIKNTIDGSGQTVRQAMKEHSSALEEGKADILGLYMVQKLRDKGEITEGEVMDNYVTFLAGIFRSIRFGASSAHGRANMIRFNFFERAGAFSRDETGAYRVNFEAFETAIEDLSRTILTMQGDGDYGVVDGFVAEFGGIGEQLQSDLDRLAGAAIPVDIVFEMGTQVLGL